MVVVIEEEREVKGVGEEVDGEMAMEEKMVVEREGAREEIGRKEDMERVRSSQSTQSTPEELTLDPPPSLNTLKKIHRKNELCLTLQARPRKKGRTLLHPRQIVAEVLGAYKAA
ncbi:hypothetical protein POM88_030492 [Heracleum sosnowskyi]|uniref:Uncharacterized protein n=1 Tax=Heracleum sosnowskyi TaxID=360622 RepID=A0AAD8MIT1_9APIA|nr:hypothetical protein POM88_030492 [Heracleum sosnowskyi]